MRRTGGRTWRCPKLDAGRLALVVTELGTNLQRHARKGRLLIAARPRRARRRGASRSTKGPASSTCALPMQDGHSSGSTPGTGLGAVRALGRRFRHALVGRPTAP